MIIDAAWKDTQAKQKTNTEEQNRTVIRHL